MAITYTYVDHNVNNPTLLDRDPSQDVQVWDWERSKWVSVCDVGIDHKYRILLSSCVVPTALSNTFTWIDAMNSLDTAIASIPDGYDYFMIATSSISYYQPVAHARLSYHKRIGFACSPTALTGGEAGYPDWVEGR